jgi:hypothetical protein
MRSRHPAAFNRLRDNAPTCNDPLLKDMAYRSKRLAQGVNADSETGALKDFLCDLVERVELED